MHAFRADFFGDDFIDCNDPEAYSLADLLQQVRALPAGPDRLPFSFATDEDILIWALATLCDSPLARAFAYDARFEDWSIELDECDDGRAIADLQMRVLILPRFMPSALALGRSHYFRHQFLAELCRGLRAVWHLDTGVRPGRDLAVHDQVSWNRMVQADYDASLLAIAWELREAGLADLWRHLLGSSELGHLAITYAALMEDSSQEPALKNIMVRLVLHWLEDEASLTMTDHRTLEVLDHYMLSPGSGRPYGSRRLEMSDLLRLSILPDESGYLLPFAASILADPNRSQMPDPVNQAHLTHILKDMAEARIVRAGFRDRNLAHKFFPDLSAEPIVDTLV
jgi:hypothetical protein